MCFCRDPEYVRTVHGIAAESMYGPRPDSAVLRRLPHGLTHAFYKVNDQLRISWVIGRADVLVVPGMGVFESALAGPPWGLPFAMAGLSVATRLRRRTLALVGVGFSEEPNRITRVLNRISPSQELPSWTFRDEYSPLGGRPRNHPDGGGVPGHRIRPRLRTTPSRWQKVTRRRSRDARLLHQYDQAAGQRVAAQFERTMVEFGRG